MATYTPLKPNQAPIQGTSGSAVLELQKQLNAKGAGLKEDALYGPLTAAASKLTPGLNTSTQSTTTLTSDKTADIKNNANKLTDLSNKGVTTNTETGVATTADGKIYNSTPQTVSADTSIEDAKINDFYNQMTSSLDANTKQAIDNIKTKFDALRNEQKDINSRQQKGIQTALLTGGVTGQGGSAQYAPISSEGIIGSQMSYGLKQIANLDAQENDLIVAAQQAQQSGNFKIMEAKLAEVEKTRQAKLDAAAELNKKIADQQAKLQEQNIQMQKDSAIADLYSSGITSTADILKQLKSSGITATAKDVSDALKNTGVEDIQKLINDASKNGATFSQIQEISQARTPAEASAIVAKYGLGRDKLDVEYKKAQLAKIYKDLEESGTSNSFGGDPTQAVAYAQQYASTGQIPTGLPKGTFGVVSQIAKELPKTQGEIVDNNTNIRSAKLTTAQTDAYSAMRDLTSKISQAEDLFNKFPTGITGALGSVFPGESRQEYNTLRSEIVDLLARARTGAAISANEEALYKSKIPGALNQTLFMGTSGENKLEGLKLSIESKLDSGLRANGVSMYGFSKVNLGGKQYTVGDTIEINGVHGRVNPDGTITKL